MPSDAQKSCRRGDHAPSRKELFSAQCAQNRLCLQVVELEAQAQEAGANTLQTEDVASTAMKAAERAVREEMEAAAVTKETKKALEKAIAGLKDLGISFAEVDDRTASKRARVLEQNKVSLG